MSKIGILTFHYPLNFGSVLQAQATQIAIEKMGYDCEIIDYRFVSADDYDKIYLQRRNGGIEGMLIKPLLYLRKKQRAERIKNYIDYDKTLVKSDKTYTSYEELCSAKDKYDVFISGSDQIWSDSVPEIVKAGPDTIKAYFLAFTEKAKIAYASCVAAMKSEDLEKYKQFIAKYSFISTREQKGAEIVKEILGMDVPVVLDPSFLLTRDEWAQHTLKNRLVNEPYALLYSLRNGEAQRQWVKAIKQFSEKRKLKIIVISPYFSYPMTGVTYMLESGPREFLNLYMNAEVVFTDTFHGTAFAVNFNKPVYSLGNKYWKKDIRKTYLMSLLGMEDRLIENEIDIVSVSDYSYNYGKVNGKLEQLRSLSLDYLKNSIEQCLR